MRKHGFVAASAVLHKEVALRTARRSALRQGPWTAQRAVPTLIDKGKVDIELGSDRLNSYDAQFFDVIIKPKGNEVMVDQFYLNRAPRAVACLVIAALARVISKLV